MAGFVEGLDRNPSSIFPASLDDCVTEDNPVRAVDAFADGLDLKQRGFTGVTPLDTGRPGYHPGTMLKIRIYGYLNRIPSSRRLERAPRNRSAAPTRRCATWRVTRTASMRSMAPP